MKAVRSLSTMWTPRPVPTLFLGEEVTDHLDVRYLFPQEVLLDEGGKVEVCLGGGQGLQRHQTLGCRLLHIEDSSHRLESSPPLHNGGLGDVLQHHPPSPLGLVLHQGRRMSMFFLRSLQEEVSEASECLVVTVEVG